jgi:hypothetical protein
MRRLSPAFFKIGGSQLNMAIAAHDALRGRPPWRKVVWREWGSLNANVIIFCAVAGAGDTVGKHPSIPVTPRRIADSAIERTLPARRSQKRGMPEQVQ